MTKQEILEKYNIKVSENDFTMERIIESDKYLYCYMDFVPISVDIKKYCQAEIIFSKKTLFGKKKKQYGFMEDKYLAVFTKLWLCSDTYAKVEEIHLSKRLAKSFVPPRYRIHMSSIFKNVCEPKMLAVPDKETLDLYTILSKRDIASIVYYFKDLHVLLLSDYSVFLLVFLKNDKYSLVDDIVKSEGFFLRPKKLNKTTEV